MPKFIVHWKVLNKTGASIVEAEATSRLTDLEVAQQMAADEMLEVYESNSSSGAVPLTAESAKEYGMAFEETNK